MAALQSNLRRNDETAAVINDIETYEVLFPDDCDLKVSTRLKDEILPYIQTTKLSELKRDPFVRSRGVIESQC